MWPDPVVADNPTNLNWENFGYSPANRNFRMIIMWSITFIVLVCTFIGVTILQIYQNQVESEFNSTKSCKANILKQNAYSD
jgi:cell division protein FtsN